MGTKKGMKRKTARRAYMPKAEMGGGGFTYGAGDGDISPREANMNQMAAGGGLKGFKSGGSVMDGMEQPSYKHGGTKKGMKRKTARRAYMKK